MSTKLINGISEIASSYKCLLLDQFGVIHDGQRAYPHAIEALNKLHEAGVSIIIISNSSRRASTTLRKLQSFNIDTRIISGVVTSGELAITTLRAFAADRPSTRVLHFNWGSASRHAVSLADHNLHVVAPCTQTLNGISVPASSDIDIIVAHGIDGLTQHDGTVCDIDWDTAVHLTRRVAVENPWIPFYCANPDLVTVDGTVLRRMPGALAKEFADAGGHVVHLLGKPAGIAYMEALRLANVAPRDVLAVGDSLGHDVLGAVDAGIDSLFIAGGIHADCFGIHPSDGFVDGRPKERFRWDAKALDAIIDEEDISLGEQRPTYVSSFFQW